MQILPYLLSLSSLFVSSVTLQNLTANAGEIINQQECTKVGRVIQSKDPGISPNSILCEEGKLRVGDRRTVLIGCYQRSENIRVKAGTYSISRLCTEERAAKSACWFVLCTRSESKVVLLSPRSSTVVETPDLEWSAVEQAKYYEIFVSSHGESTFRSKTQDTLLKLSQQYSFKPGKIYRIDIYASSQDKILGNSVFSLRVPTQAELQEMHETIAIVNSSSISKDEKIRLIDSSYMTLGLTIQAIAYLESVEQNSKSLLVAKLLADRYAEIGHPEKARDNYEIVARKTPKDSEDFKFATKMLARIAALKP